MPQECPVCFEFYSDSGEDDKFPQILKCGHSFCSCCIKTFGVPMLCPLCREKSAPEDVRDNFSLLASGGQDSPDDNVVVTCQNPRKHCQNVVTMYCEGCKYEFCKACSDELHKSDALLKNHDPVSIGDLIPKCVIHPDMRADLLCEGCKVIVCIKCSMVGKHKGPEHPVREVTEVSQEIRAKLQNTKGLIHQLGESTKSRKQELMSDRQNINDNGLEAHAEVKRMYESLFRQVEDRTHVLQNQIEDFHLMKVADCEEKLHEVDAVRSLIAKVCEKTDTLLEKNNYYLLDNATSVEANLANAEIETERVLQLGRPDTLIEIIAPEFKSIVNNLRSLGGVGVPAAPGLVTKYNELNHSLVVSWQPSDSKNSISTYTLEIKRNHDNEEAETNASEAAEEKEELPKDNSEFLFNKIYSGTDLEFVVTNLAFDGQYSLRVRADNGYRRGKWSQTEFSVPSKPCLPLIMSSEFLGQGIQSDLLKLFDGKQVKLRLLYKATVDGFDQFSARCDNTARTLIIARSENGHIGGGYATAKWDGTGVTPQGYVQNTGQFIFSLEPTLLKLNCSNIPFAQYSKAGYGVYFGQSGDLSIRGNVIGCGIGSYSTVAPGFAAPDSGITDSTLFGAANLTAAEVEVFEVTE